jgi:arginine decarboxylase
VISREILDFMAQLDVKEIHGYEPDLGFQVFTEAALARLDEHHTRPDPNQTPNDDGALAPSSPDPAAAIPDPAPVAVPAPADDTASA